MAEPEMRPVNFDDGLACGFDDAWHEAWWRQMEESGGNIIAYHRMRMVDGGDGFAVMEMDYHPGARQGTGVYASGILMQLADVAATSACFGHMRKNAPEDATEFPFPLAVQISVNVFRNTDHGKIIAEARVTHGGRMMMVVDSTVKDEEGRLLARVTTTHLVPPQRR